MGKSLWRRPRGAERSGGKAERGSGRGRGVPGKPSERGLETALPGKATLRALREAPTALQPRARLGAAMAGALPAGPRESLPCAAPAPLPPPSPCGSPDPAVALSPDRGGGGGILRREQQQKPPGPRRVRFRVAEQAAAAGLPAQLSRRDPRGAPGGSRPPPAASQLGAPLPHSSLALGAEVRARRRQAFDARQAAEQLVQRSFVARCAAEARVAEGLNIPREQQLYQGLISLQVPADEVLSSAVQGRLALVQYQPGDRKEAAGEGPDLMAFYRPGELFTETPFLEVGGLPPLKLQAQRRHPATTFLMYRKLQQWAS